MTKLQWAGVVGALGLGIVSQIPTHDQETMPGHELGMAAMSVDSGPATVTLNVTGMT